MNLEDICYPIGKGQWRCNMIFSVSGHQKVFHVYSYDLEEMREITENGLPDYAATEVYEYMQKYIAKSE